MKNMTILSATAVTVLALSGCATTAKQTAIKNQCDNPNWQELGYRYAMHGNPATVIDNQKHCQPTENQRLTWQQGYDEGLKNYCTTLTAYKLGREGIAFNNICPSEKTIELLKANDEGYYYFQRERNLYQWQSPYYPPFWHSGFGFGRYWW